MKPSRTLTSALGAFFLATALNYSVFAASTAQNTPALPTASTPSKISAATVYTDRAIITRTARADLAAGETNIVLEKLPADFVDDSVQVSGRGTASATILDVSSKITYTDKIDEANEPRVKALKDELLAIDKMLRALNGRDATLQQQINLIGKIENAIAAPPGKDTPASQPKIEDMQKLLTFSQDNRDKLTENRYALADEIAEKQNKRSALQAQLNEVLSGGGERKSYKTVTVRVSAAKAGSLDLTIAYTVHSASWMPAYDVRLRAEAREVELAYFGIVRQSSGEDWNNIALTLSTARPGLGGGAPAARPWFVDVYVPKPVTQTFISGKATQDATSVYALRAPAGVGAGATGGYAGNRVALGGDGFTNNSIRGLDAINGSMLFGAGNVSSPPITNADYAAATVNNATTSASFKIAATTSIPSDNTPQKVSIMATKFAAKLQYQATPALQETAFLSAYVLNSTDFPLLAGSANVFLDDAFVSTASLKTVMPSEKFQLTLGADEGVAIKRRVVNRFSESTGLTGKGRRVSFEYLITITNNKKTPERVVFTEALPVSKNEKIVANLLSPAEREVGTLEKPGKEITREEDNKLVWRIDMKPGEKREIPVKFNLEFPGDIQVTGLE